MKIVLTVELVWVVIVILYLDRGMEEFVLSSAEVGHLLEGSQGVLRNDMTTHRVLTSTDRPDVEIMDLLNVFDLEDICFKLLNFDVSWGTFHENKDAVFEDRDRSAHDNH